jgi:hypothetical protein
VVHAFDRYYDALRKANLMQIIFLEAQTDPGQMMGAARMDVK